jgi:hypothetical protein
LCFTTNSYQRKGVAENITCGFSKRYLIWVYPSSRNKQTLRAAPRRVYFGATQRRTETADDGDRFTLWWHVDTLDVPRTQHLRSGVLSRCAPRFFILRCDDSLFPVIVIVRFFFASPRDILLAGKPALAFSTGGVLQAARLKYLKVKAE